MSHIWTFSPKSQVLLQQCLNAAATTGESNEWLKHFGPKNVNLIKKLDNTVLIPDSSGTEVKVKQENQDQEILSALEELMDQEFDVVSNFNTLQEKCCLMPKILTKVAENLALDTAEKLIRHVLDTKDIDNKFLDNFFEYFLPVYIKRDNSRTSTDLLLKTYKLFAQYFIVLVTFILKDIEIQNNILNDFILTLSSNKQTEFLNKISGIELTGEQFTHNLFNIYTAYKGCNKTDNIQNYIFSVLNSHSQFCCTDKNYGKLLLAYLQQEKNLKHVRNKLMIETIVETHKSPFKRPCLTVLNEINYS